MRTSARAHYRKDEHVTRIFSDKNRVFSPLKKLDLDLLLWSNAKIWSYQILVYTNSVTLVFQAIWLVRYLGLLNITHFLGSGYCPCKTEAKCDPRKLALCQRFRIRHFRKYRALQSQKTQRKSRTVCNRFSRCSCVSAVLWRNYLERSSLLSRVNSVAHQLSKINRETSYISLGFLWHFGGHLVWLY